MKKDVFIGYTYGMSGDIAETACNVDYADGADDGDIVFKDPGEARQLGHKLHPQEDLKLYRVTVELIETSEPPEPLPPERVWKKVKKTK